MKKKLALADLKVKSFVTTIEVQENQRVLGGFAYRTTNPACTRIVNLDEKL